MLALPLQETWASPPMIFEALDKIEEGLLCLEGTGWSCICRGSCDEHHD